MLHPPGGRGALIERLPDSLREEAVPEVDSAWITEAERRYREYKEGRVEGIPAEMAFEEIHQELGWSS